MAERVSGALKYKLANHTRAGNVAYGFDLLSDGETLKTNEQEQATIEAMQKMRSVGGVYRILGNQTLKVAA